MVDCHLSTWEALSMKNIDFVRHWRTLNWNLNLTIVDDDPECSLAHLLNYDNAPIYKRSSAARTFDSVLTTVWPSLKTKGRSLQEARSSTIVMWQNFEICEIYLKESQLKATSIIWLRLLATLHSRAFHFIILPRVTTPAKSGLDKFVSKIRLQDFFNTQPYFVIPPNKLVVYPRRPLARVFDTVHVAQLRTVLLYKHSHSDHSKLLLTRTC